MSDQRHLLIEIGTEEMPARLLEKLATAFANNFKTQLDKNELSHREIKSFVTPRRLALLISDLVTQQPRRKIERKGPALEAAFDKNGKPTPASIGFAKSCGIEVAQLKTQKSDKGEFLYFAQEVAGQTTQQLLPEIIIKAINELQLPRMMRWDHQDVSFIRPVHWAIVLFGKELIKMQILGVTTDHHSYGHRFLHPQAVKIKSANDYENSLEKAYVIADFSKRLEKIKQQLNTISKAKGQINLDEDLLNEVTGLVEWPVALCGNFESRFLDIPAEALISSMKTHQKSFPLLDQHQHLLPHFVTISNIESKNPAQVIAGNERVIRARLSDAEFFFHTDLKHSLASRVNKLNDIVFQQKLGSLYDKAERIKKLATHIAKQINSNSEEASRAAILAKTDLLSEMVGEFPELQGIMGYYYALQDKETSAVATAIKEHYLPRFSGDQLPNSVTGQIIAIADRLDTLVGIFGINQAPTGEKDPFGLRRAANGILRIIIEKRLTLDLQDLIEHAINNYGVKLDSDTGKNSLSFIFERLRAWYSEQNISNDVFEAVLIKNITQPLDFHHRILAVQQFKRLPEAQSLAAANKRVSNILKKEESAFIHAKVNPNLLQHDAEKQLATALEHKTKDTEMLYQQGNYTAYLTELAALQTPIDQFFDHVMVNVEDEKIRNNRFALLANIRQLFTQVADISLLQ